MVNPSLNSALLFCLPLVTLSSAQWGSGSGSGGGGGGGGGSGGGSGWGGGGGGGGGASMTTSSSSSGTTAASSPGAIQTVDVGDGGYVFEPDTIHAAPGEKIEFHFYPNNHSVVQAAFDKPCEPMSASSIFSGFVPTSGKESSTIFTLTVNDTNPIWFYCGQNTPFDHCNIGMVGVINPPSSGPDTLAAFKHAASQTTTSGVPAQAQGGVLSTEKESENSTTTSTPSMSGSSSASGSATPTSSTGEAGRLHYSDLSVLSILTFAMAAFMM